MLNIIALSGPKGSGKTTAANILSAKLDVPICSFAEPIKWMAEALLTSYDMYGAEYMRYLYGDAKEEEIPFLGCSARKILQTLGTEWAKPLFGKDIWARILMKRVEIGVNSEENPPFISAIIDDMRFFEEYNYLNARSKLLVLKLVRATTSIDEHISENGFSYIPGKLILNISAQEDLYDELLDAVTDFMTIIGQAEGREDHGQ